MSKNNSKPKKTAEEKITEQMIAMIETTKVLPWEKPWVANPESCQYHNHYTGKPYSLLNQMLLSMHSAMNGFKCNAYLGFGQAKKMKGFVKRGSKSVFIWVPIMKKGINKDSITGEEEEYFYCVGFRTQAVFNVEQTSLKVPETKPIDTTKIFNPVKEAEAIVKAFKSCPTINHGGDSAYYRPSTDQIQMPHQKDFRSEESYYGTLFHEMVHSTGHKSRLARKGVAGSVLGKTKADYSYEELIAEFGACFLQSSCNILTKPERENAAAYLKNWVKVLKDDPTMLMKAAGEAEKAVKFIKGKLKVKA